MTQAGNVQLGTPGDISGFSDSAVQIGFDTLYGLSSRSWSYNGETPGEDYSKDYKDYIKGTQWIDGKERVWYNDPTQIDAGLAWSSDGTKDLHAKNILSTSLSKDFAGIVSSGPFNVLAAINQVLAYPTDLFIYIANIDVTGLLNILHWESFNNAVKTMFIGDGLNSPVLILAIVIFLIGLAAMVTKYITSGGQALSAIGGEIATMFLAMFILAIAVNGTYTNLVTTFSNFTISLTQSINVAGDESATSLYTYQTGDTTTDAAKTQIGLTAKTYVDMVIKSRLGYSVDELKLWDDTEQTTQENWGISKSDMQDIVKKISGGDINTFMVKTSDGTSNGTYTTGDLGYWYYATLSGADPSNPYTIKNGKVVINNGNANERMYYMADLLAAIDAKTGGSAKAQTIMSNLSNSGYDWAGMFLCCLVTIFLTLSLVFPTMFTLFGKVLFNVGIIFIPIMPVLILIRQTRDYAKKMLNTWLVSAIKMVVGQIIVYLILYMSVAVSASGSVGMIIDILILFAFSKYVPLFISRINQTVSNNFDQLEFARRADQSFGSFASKVYGNRGFAKNMNSIASMRDQMREKKQQLMNISNNKDFSEETQSGEGRLALNNIGGGSGSTAGSPDELTMLKAKESLLVDISGGEDSLSDEQKSDLAAVSKIDNTELVDDYNEQKKVFDENRKTELDNINSSTFANELSELGYNDKSIAALVHSETLRKSFMEKNAQKRAKRQQAINRFADKHHIIYGIGKTAGALTTASIASTAIGRTAYDRYSRIRQENIDKKVKNMGMSSIQRFRVNTSRRYADIIGGTRTVEHAATNNKGDRKLQRTTTSISGALNLAKSTRVDEVEQSYQANMRTLNEARNAAEKNVQKSRIRIVLGNHDDPQFPTGGGGTIPPNTVDTKSHGDNTVGIKKDVTSANQDDGIKPTEQGSHKPHNVHTSPRSDKQDNTPREVKNREEDLKGNKKPDDIDNGNGNNIKIQNKQPKQQPQGQPVEPIEQPKPKQRSEQRSEKKPEQQKQVNTPKIKDNRQKSGIDSGGQESSSLQEGSGSVGRPKDKSARQHRGASKKKESGDTTKQPDKTEQRSQQPKESKRHSHDKDTTSKTTKNENEGGSTSSKVTNTAEESSGNGIKERVVNFRLKKPKK